MNEYQIKKILAEDWEYKKDYKSNYGHPCKLCGEQILDGDTIYFYGDRQVLCENCYAEVGDYLEGEKI
jgi:hypothetical protein